MSSDSITESGFARGCKGLLQAAWMVFLLAHGVVGCRSASDLPDRVTFSPTRGYILISIDTLRADHLGLYGYEKATSPFLDSLAKKAAVFDNAIAHVPSTLPSHMSMFTGLYPSEHGVHPPDGILSPLIETLPEVFLNHGYKTAGFTDGGYVSGRYGFARGFSEFSDQTVAFPNQAEGIFEQGSGFLKSLGPRERFFLFLHTYAVHDPYQPPEPYRSRFWSEPPPPGAFEPTGPNFLEFNCGDREVSPEALKYYEALYDAGINYVDNVLRDFFADVEALGLLADTTIVITSDHGEEFLEHGLLSHIQIYHHTLHVPLLVVHPNQRQPLRIEYPVQTIDIPAMMYDLAGLHTESRISGRSLVPDLEETRSHFRGEAYAESDNGRNRSVYHQGKNGELLQLIRSIRTGSGKEVGPVWVTPRSLSFDSSDDQITFRARSFMRPRQLTISVDGVVHSTFDLDTTWKTIELDLQKSAQARVISLSGSDCSPASMAGSTADCRCLSFMVDGVGATRSELYDVSVDPLEEENLSMLRADTTRDLYERFGSYSRERKSSPRREELSPDLEERLRALGYIQ